MVQISWDPRANNPKFLATYTRLTMTNEKVVGLFTLLQKSTIFGNAKFWHILTVPKFGCADFVCFDAVAKFW